MSEQELNNAENDGMTDSEKKQAQNLPSATEQTTTEERPGKFGFKRSVFRKIINTFISAFLVLLIISLVVLGFTQTKTFRELLREKVIALVNEEINGKLNIEKIDGTLLTSLYLHNTSIVVDNDTLLFASNVEVKTSPVQLLLKKIH
ncbi:MAG: hypothetical protein Q8L04_14450, partial [Ignavibacteria bacterium]|nr:hypothetical protein [Ignavibacteria bacterium]